MPNYRRANVPGGTYFFTVALQDRRGRLLVEHVATLRHAFLTTRAARGFDLLAIAVLPDHLHCVWRLPDEDADNAIRWRQIKREFSRALDPLEPRSESRRKRGERGVWQRRYWERLIVDQDDLRAHVDYVHFNPVKHCQVRCAVDWPYSSIHRYIRRGDLTAEWGGDGGLRREGCAQGAPYEPIRKA